MPYLAYARKDQRTKAHDPVSLRYVAQLFDAVGVAQLIVLEARVRDICAEGRPQEQRLRVEEAVPWNSAFPRPETFRDSS